MFVNRLALVVVVWRLQAIRSGDGLRGLVRLEARVERPLSGRERHVAFALITEHQVVMRLEILRIYGKRLREARDRVIESALQEMDAADLVQHNPVAWVLVGGDAEVIERLRVAP